MAQENSLLANPSWAPDVELWLCHCSQTHPEATLAVKALMQLIENWKCGPPLVQRYIPVSLQWEWTDWVYLNKPKDTDENAAWDIYFVFHKWMVDFLLMLGYNGFTGLIHLRWVVCNNKS